MTECELSIISPMHNEEGCAKEFVTRVASAIETKYPNYEIIIINDGATDNTESILRECAQKQTRLKVINLARNSGQWAATFAGI